EHFRDLVRSAQQAELDALAIAGRDADIALALNALEALNRVPLAFLPTATSDFATALAIPRRLADALQLLETAQPQRVDVARATWPGRPDSRRFCTTAALGIAERANGDSSLPAVAAWLVAFAGARPQALRVTWQGGSYEGETLLAVVTNTPARVG